MDPHQIIETTQNADVMKFTMPTGQGLKLDRDLLLELAKAQEAISAPGLPGWTALEWIGAITAKLGMAAISAGQARSHGEAGLTGEELEHFVGRELEELQPQIAAVIIGAIDLWRAVHYGATTELQ